MRLAVTVDDLPAHEAPVPGCTRREVTGRVARALGAAGVQAACGFVNPLRFIDSGESCDDVLAAWIGAGFTVGNHGARHLDLHIVGTQLFADDIAVADTYLRSRYPGAFAPVFRFPFLHEGETHGDQAAAQAVLARLGLCNARVTVNFGDWIWNLAHAELCAWDAGATEPLAELERRFLAAACDGLALARHLADALFEREIPHVLLLHNGAFTAQMIPGLFELFARAGVELIGLDEALADPALRAPGNELIASGYTWLHQLARHRGLGGALRAPPERGIERLMQDLRSQRTP